MCFKGANVHGCYTNVPMAETTLKDIWILEIAPFALIKEDWKTNLANA